MAVYAKKSGLSIFMAGILVLVILSILGLVYLTRIAFENGYYNSMTNAEKGIARISILALWLLVGWVVLGSELKNIWK